jgi:hypothetical protein
VQGGCRRVNPPCSHKSQRGKRPKKHHNKAQPQNKGSEETLPRRGLGGDLWRCCHTSE